MTVHSDTPPGIELDRQMRVIPIEQRTEDDRRTPLEQKQRK
jgi:hypothetical protein